MKVEKSDLDKQALSRLLQTAYGIDVVRLEFVPKGEESYSYVASTTVGRKYFVKVHLASASPELEASYRFVHHLHADKGFEWAVSPYITREDQFLGTLGNYAVAVFDYLSGLSRSPSELSGPQLERFAKLVTQLHGSISSTRSSRLPKESFELSFNAWLMDVLSAVELPLQTNHAWSQLAYNLIRVEKPKILDIIDYVKEIAPALQVATHQWAVTHGDLSSENIIQDEHGNLFLIDWGKLCIAPAARDLISLWENENAPLVTAYFELAQDSFALLEQTLVYYLYCNLLATITDYGSWLILEEATPAEAEHAWTKLSQVLPLNVQKVPTTANAISEIATNASPHRTRK